MKNESKQIKNTVLISQNQVRGMSFTFYTKNQELKSFLLMPSEVVEILRQMNELGWSIEKCFERMTGKDASSYSHILLNLKIG